MPASIYWKYNTNGCRLTIAPRSDGKFDLIINDDVAGVYRTAQAAADDVFTCTTGNYEWDRIGTVDQPTDLGEWVAQPAKVPR